MRKSRGVPSQYGNYKQSFGIADCAPGQLGFGMALTTASAHLSDKAFLADFSTCELPLTLFHHGDHLRLAWIQLHRHPFELALKLVQKGIQDYAQHYGVPHIFHETITTAWVILLATHNESNFSAFIKANERSLCPELLHRFWTPDALNSNAARQGWVPPDKAALPK